MSTAGWHEHCPQSDGGEYAATFAEQELTSSQTEEIYIHLLLQSFHRPRKDLVRKRTAVRCSSQSHKERHWKPFCGLPKDLQPCISHTWPKLLHCAMQMQNGIILTDPNNSSNNLTSSKCFLQACKSLMHREAVVCCFLIPSFPLVWDFTAMMFLWKPSKLPAPISCRQLIWFYPSFPWILQFIVNCSEAPRHTARSTMEPGKLQLPQLLVVKWDCENK